ncbi:MAG: hypothetical protein ACLGHX_08105 [Acidimicrobiia bacterium]
MAQRLLTPRRVLPSISVVVVMAMVTGACTSSGQSVTTEQTSASATSGQDGIPTPPPPAPIAPVLRVPGGAAGTVVGNPTLVAAAVMAANPIVRTELWAGSELVAERTYSEPATEVRDAFEWAPRHSGVFGLVLRAVDAEGGVATSFPLWLRAVAPAAPEGVTTAPVQFTFPRIKQVSYMPPADPAFGAISGPPELSVVVDEGACTVNLALPAVQGASGMALYGASFGTGGFVPIALLPPTGGSTSFAIGSSPVMVYADVFDSATALPGPPELVLPPNPCVGGVTGGLHLVNGVLSNPWGADRAYLYASRDDGSTWERVPTEDQTFVTPDPTGAFDFSALLSPPAPGTQLIFEAWGWVGGGLKALGTGVWAEDKPETAPAGAGDGVAAAGGLLIPDSDLDWYLGEKAGGGGPILVRDCTICTYPPQQAVEPPSTGPSVSVVGGQSTTSTSGAPPIATLPDSCTNAPFGGYSETFRWKPIGGAASHGLVQVAVAPPPSGPSTSFPGLIHVQQVAWPAAGHTDFEVPIADLISTPTVVEGGWETLKFEVALNLAGLGGSPVSSYSMAAPQLLGGPKPSVLYVRVVPMQGANALLGESNVVSIHIEDTPPPPKGPAADPSPAFSLAVSMTPPHLSNPAYSKCVRVLENPFGAKNPAPWDTKDWQADNPELVKSLWLEINSSQYLKSYYLGAETSAFVFENGIKVHKGLVPGATVCASTLPEPSKDAWDYVVDAVNFITYVWDLYAAVWDMIKSWAADLLAHLSGCVILAEQAAKASGMNDTEAEAFAAKQCKAIAETAINTALIAYGVPPSMPKFAELVEAGKGEMSELVVQWAKDQGLDCSVFQAQCDEMAKELLEGLLDQIQTAASQAAVQAVNTETTILKIHPAIKVIPEPAGTVSPAMFEVEITRNADPTAPPPPPSCTYQALVYGDKTSYSWQDYLKGVWREGEPVSTATVMGPKTITVDLAGVLPGETISTTVILDQILPWYPPGQNPQLPKMPYYVTPQTWIFFHGVDSTLTTALVGAPGCGTATQAHPQDTKHTEPWEIPYP